MGAINTSKVLKIRTFVSSESTYTATENCYAQITLKSNNNISQVARVNDVAACYLNSDNYTETISVIPLKKGDVLKVTGSSTYNSNYAVFGSE